MNYNPQKIESKWQKRWRKEGVYQPELKKADKPFYNLMMFPYPSAEGLHVGNMYAFTGADIYGRFKRMQGFDVLEPIGLDGFGIHSENYALKVGEHPRDVAQRTEKNFYKQLEATGNGYAWENTLETYDPDYYRWTQWLFIKMHDKGLVERRRASVNWCPGCKTVLSDEQVIQGQCERCDCEVLQKKLEQWFFKITDYAEKLLDNLEEIDWPQRIKEMQKNWIGRSEGARFEFGVEGTDQKISIFTTRPDTVYGTSFIVLAPEHPLVDRITVGEQSSKVEAYKEKAKRKSFLERTQLSKEKTGVETGSKAVNPFNGCKIPIFVADFVVMDYGTGAIMGVPAHDERDHEFAQKYDLPVIKVIDPKPISVYSKSLIDEASGAQTEIKLESECWTGEGKLINSGEFNALESVEARERMTKYAEQEGFGDQEVNYRLRDWCISRQRYWGPPIPMIKCEKCGWVPVPEKDLPVKLPHLDNYQPQGMGDSPLAQLEDWVKIECPQCGGPAERETDVSDTFLDSSWYFLRYPTVGLESAGRTAFDKEVTSKWLPVDMYIGGAEHAVLHLMYARFVAMVLNDLDLIDFEEPFQRLYAHGLLTKDGAKISKSKGNVIVPDNYIQKLGADTLRTYLMFLGPFDQGGDFTDSGIMGTHRFLNDVWKLVLESSEDPTPTGLEKDLHRTIKKVTEDIGELKYNTALAAMMEFKNQWASAEQGLCRRDAKKFIKILAPFAPHITEELWERTGQEFSVHQSSWPDYDPQLVRRDKVTLVIEVGNKIRDKIEVASGFSEEEAKQAALSSSKVQKWLKGKKIKRVVFVPDKLINFVVNGK